MKKGCEGVNYNEVFRMGRVVYESTNKARQGRAKKAMRKQREDRVIEYNVFGRRTVCL
jgi:hypothetical protein